VNANSLGVAIVGCGRVAGHHCVSIGAIDGVRVVAVCDFIEDRAAPYGAQFGVPHYLNYHEMLHNHPEADIVAVVTPSGMHFEHALDIVERHSRHVIVEKPTFMRPDQIDRVYSAAGERNRHVFPVFQNRYNKAVERVRRAITDGELGNPRIVSVRVRWCRPQRYYDMAPWRGTFSHDGGALTNQGIHHVDLLRHLGGEVRTVHATMRTLGADIEVEDTVVATLEYESGAVGSVEVTTAARPDDFGASISIVGENGLAQIGGIGVNELQIFTPYPDTRADHSEVFVGIEGRGAVYGYGHEAVYRDIVAFLRDDASYPVDRDDCSRTIRLLHAFYLSDERSAPVDVGPDTASARLGRPDDTISDLYRTPSPEAGTA